MSPDHMLLFESGARVTSALILGAFLVVAAKAVLRNTERGRGGIYEELDVLRNAVHELGWRVDRLHERQAERLRNLEQRLDFTEQLVGRSSTSLEARH